MADRNGRRPGSADAAGWNIPRVTRGKFSSEEESRIVLEVLPGKEIIAELCLKEGIN